MVTLATFLLYSINIFEFLGEKLEISITVPFAFLMTVDQCLRLTPPPPPLNHHLYIHHCNVRRINTWAPVEICVGEGGGGSSPKKEGPTLGYKRPHIRRT